MTKDILVTAVAYAITVASFIAWIYIGKPDRIPRTRKTVFALCLRSIPLFLIIYMICHAFNITAVIGLVFLAAIAFFSLLSVNLGGLPGVALLYVLQQWILGWPDRSLLVNNVCIESSRDHVGSIDPLIGHTARSASPLRPAGKIVSEGKEIDATSEYGYIDAGIEVMIIGKRDFTYLVNPLNIQAEQAGPAYPPQGVGSADP